MNLESLLARSGATDEFKASVRQYSTQGKAPLVEASGFAPQIKVLRVLAQLLDVEQMLPLERVRVEGGSTVSGFRTRCARRRSLDIGASRSGEKA